MNPPIVFLLCGVAGSGKTTLAKQIQWQRSALHLSLDEWAAVVPIEDEDIAALQWLVATRALVLGIDVILDWGFDSRAERDDLRARAAAIGAETKLVFLDAPRAELWRRVARRNACVDPEFRVTKIELDSWSSEFEPPAPDEKITPAEQFV